MEPRHRHVAITGGSSGIGAALAVAYASPGCRISLAGRDLARLDVVAEACRARGAHVSRHAVDVTDAGAVRAWIQAIDAEMPIDLVYANAGVGGTQALTTEVGEAPGAATLIVHTNLLGVIHTAEAALDRFRARGRGHFVAVGSLAGRLGLPHSPSYSASKAAVATYMDGMRRVMKPLGIDMTLIEPGFVDTPMSQGLPDRDWFLWTAERAAREIRAAVDARRAVFAFPWQLDVVLRLARLLPRPLQDIILINAHRKARLG